MTLKKYINTVQKNMLIKPFWGHLINIPHTIIGGGRVSVDR